MRGWGGEHVLVVAVGTLALTSFGSRELLDIAIPTLVTIVFILSLY